MSEKSQNALRTIGEVSEELDVANHVLRFWESKFKQIKPQKRRGRRYYSVQDIEIIKTIKSLLHEKGYTIRGAQKFFIEQKRNQKAPVEQNLNNEEYETDLFGNKIDENNQIIEKSENQESLESEIDISEIEEIKNSLINLKSKLQSI